MVPDALHTSDPDSLTAAMHALTQPDLGISPARLMLVALVLAALVGGAWWLSRRGGGVRLKRAVGQGVRVVQRVPVGRRQSLLLVEVEGRRILVGSTPNSLTSLSEWDDEPAAADAPDQPPARAAATRRRRPEDDVAKTFDGVLARLRTVREPS